MSIIKPKRGTGSPAGSIETNEIAMDTAAKVLYTSTDGTTAIQLADDSRIYLENVSYFLGDFNAGGYPQTAVLGNNKISSYGAQNASIAIRTGQYAAGANKGPVQIDALSLDMDSNPIINAESLTIKDTIGTNPDMTLTQDQYTPNAIEINADKAEAGKRSSLWWNYDDAGTKEYVGQLMWQADGGSPSATGNHYFRIASYKNGPNSDVIFDSWKNNYTRISNGFHTSGNAPIGYLELTQDKVNSNMRLDIQNGRTNSGSGLSPHALFCETDMSQDATLDIMNSATFNTTYGSQTKLNGIQNSISFGIENDADGYSSVGRMTAVYNSDGLNNQFRIQSTNEAGSGANTLEGGSVVGNGNGKADITCLAFSTNVPYQMPKYTVAQLATLTAGEGMQVYCLDGDGGNSCLAVYDGSNWKRVALGLAVST